MKLTGHFAAPRLDLERYRRQLAKHMAEVVSQAAMEWLDRVLMEIPIWSGASQATFTHLARDIGFQLPIGSDSSYEYAMSMRRANVPVEVRIPRGIAESDGGIVLNDKAGLFYFHYSTNLPWLVWNEYHNANIEPDPMLFDKLRKPGPYHFQKLGATVFKAFADDVGLLSVSQFVKAGKAVKVG